MSNKKHPSQMKIGCSMFIFTLFNDHRIPRPFTIQWTSLLVFPIIRNYQIDGVLKNELNFMCDVRFLIVYVCFGWNTIEIWTVIAISVGHTQSVIKIGRCFISLCFWFSSNRYVLKLYYIWKVKNEAISNGKQIWANW